MKVTCPKCKTRLVLPDEKLTTGGMKFRCSKCGATLAYKGKTQRPSTESAADPAPLPPQPSAAEPRMPPPRVLPDNEERPLAESGPPTNEVHPEGIVPAAVEARNPEGDREKIKLKKTEAADEIFRGFKPPSLLSRNAVLTASGAVLFIIALAVVFLNGHGQKQSDVQPAVQNSLPRSGPSATPDADASRNEATVLPSSPAMPSEMTDEKAIELVKKSVEPTVNKWAAENSGKYSIIGWQAKKVDEQSYLVSYLARAGDKTTGFHFALDVRTGAIQDIANNWDLQKKYNIQYGSSREAAQSPHPPEGR